MRVFIFIDQDGKHIVDEEEVRRTYWPYWRERMERMGKHTQIDFENCLDDWTVVHWAVPYIQDNAPVTADATNIE